MRIVSRGVATVAVVIALSGFLQPDAGAHVIIETIGPPNSPVGTTIFFKATAPAADPYLFRFRAGPVGGPLRLTRDFSTRTHLDWTPMADGAFEIEVTARHLLSGETAIASTTYVVASRVTAGEPVVSATLHPLVALYSAPPCTAGLIRVTFVRQGGGRAQATPFKPCIPGRSANFHVAGLQAATNYELRHEIISGGGTVLGPTLAYRTPVVSTAMPPIVVMDPQDEPAPVEGVVLHSMLISHVTKTFPVATDVDGRVIWYYDKSMYPWQTAATLFRPLPGGNMLLGMNDYGIQWQLLREIDIAGNSVRETTVPRVNAQLAELGHQPITSFHHDALALPNGRMLVLASVERILTDVQGPGPVDVLGDMLIELDEDWQVTWAWNAFDHLDPRRVAVLGETCTGPADGCRPLRLAPRANDWLHTNTITYSPADGNVLLSVRHQDWIVKIDYRNGTGTGAVVWRLGKNGDFVLAGGDETLWFSHQHDVRFNSANTLLLYDNGNVRCAPDPATCQSRGQIIEFDEMSGVAFLRMNTPLGHYSPAMGSAQRLANGNYHFGSGWVYPGPHSEALEFRSDGGRVFAMAAALAYRSFRMRDMYSP